MDKDNKSITSLLNEMKKAIKNSSDYSWLITNCANQKKLAYTSNIQLNIIGVSLNTFKKNADDYIEGGFAAIDKLRKQLKCKKCLSIKEKKERAKNKNTSQQKKLEESERIRAELLRAYADLNKIALNAIISSDQYADEYEEHQALYMRYLGLKLVNKDE